MKRVVARELMDDPVDSRAELDENLADIEFANRVFGGVAPVLREFRRSGARSMLDVCCGSADIPLHILRDARRRGHNLGVTVLDRSEMMLAIARTRAPAREELRFVAGDAMALPFDDGSFDLVTCNLALHHFEPPQARQLLAEIRRVARIVPLVCDLRRSRAAWLAALTWSRLGSRNRLTRHDAPLSVRRAYTPDEVLGLAADAGWTLPVVRREAFFRMTLADRGTVSGARS